MIYSVTGEIAGKGDNFLVLEVSGLGLKIFTHERMLRSLSSLGEKVKLFCHLQVKEDALDLYGFLSEDELRFFELLISVSGVGPRSALSILQIADLGQLAAAIKEGRPDMLTRASGVGQRTAERVIVELKNKVEAPKSDVTMKRMEADTDIIEILGTLGYPKFQAREALSRVDHALSTLEDRLKAALKILSGKE